MISIRGRNSELLVGTFLLLLFNTFSLSLSQVKTDFEEVEVDTVFRGNTSVSNVNYHSKVVVCYVGTWAFYRPEEGKYDLLESFDPRLCTHLIYSFAGLDNVTNELKPLDPNLDLEEQWGKGWFKKVTSLKQRHSHLRVLLAIGGWNEGSEKYSDMASDSEKRKVFVESALSTIRKFGFDGLDLDWEFPARRGGKPEDKQHFTTLVRELRDKFDKYGLMLTAAFGASKEIGDVAYELAELSKLLDHIHIMCYDYHGSWDPTANHNAPLFAPTENLSVAASVEYFISQGASPDKLVLGLPLYGRTFLLTGDPVGSGLDKPSGNKGFQGPFTREDGFLGYNEICKELAANRGHWKTYWDSNARVPYMRNGAKWMSFDNPESLYQKVEYAVARGLRGAMVWSMDTDDFLGVCGGPKYPLMQSINYALAVEENKRRKTPTKGPGGDKKKKPTSAGCDTKAALTFTILFNIVAIRLNAMFSL